MSETRTDEVVAAVPADERFGDDVLRGAFGNHPTGVVSVTVTAPDGSTRGALAGCFGLASFDPPLVSFTLPPEVHDSLSKPGRGLHAHVLAGDQAELARALLGTGAHEIQAGDLDGAVLHVECTEISHQRVGDRVLVVASVVGVRQQHNMLPLLRYQRGYGAFAHGPLLLDEPSVSTGLPRLPVIAEEVELVAEELGVECSVQVVDGEEVRIVLTSNRAPDRDVSRLGLSVPLVPPVGTLFVARAPEEERDRWLAALGPDRPTLQDAVIDKVRRVRERGWAVVVDDGRGGHLDELVRDYSARERSPEARDAFVETIRRMLPHHEPDLRHDQLYDLIQVSAPVVDRDGTVVMVLRLGSLPRQASLAEIDWWARRAQQAASLISDALPLP